MSVTKRVWIENDPAFQGVREARSVDLAEKAKEFSYRLKANRFELSKSGRRKRSAFWPIALEEAIQETEAEFIEMNGGLFFRSVVERDRVEKIASLYFSDTNALLKKRQQRQPAKPLAFREGCCPVCGTTMIRRTVKKGLNVGTKFWGCRMFPMCRGTRPWRN